MYRGSTESAVWAVVLYFVVEAEEFGVDSAFPWAVGCALLDDAGAAEVGVARATAVEHFLLGLEAYRT